MIGDFSEIVFYGNYLKELEQEDGISSVEAIDVDDQRVDDNGRQPGHSVSAVHHAVVKVGSTGEVRVVLNTEVPKMDHAFADAIVPDSLEPFSHFEPEDFGGGRPIEILQVQNEAFDDAYEAVIDDALGMICNAIAVVVDVVLDVAPAQVHVGRVYQSWRTEAVKDDIADMVCELKIVPAGKM